MNVLIYLVTILVFCVAGFLSLSAGLKRLRCDRTFSQPSAFVGEEGAFIETVCNDSPYMIPWLRLEFLISPHIQMGREDNFYNNAEAHYSSLFTLMPYQQIRRTHPVKFLHRGEYDLGAVSMTVGDVFGFRQLRRKYAMRAPVLVYPRLLDSSELPAPIARLMGDISSRRRLMEDPFLLRGIRTYYPGDPVGDIHWPATARVGETQLRVRDYTARSRLMVVLNVQGRELQWSDKLQEELEPVMEHAISMAATICVQALHAGMAAGFAANMPQGTSGESTILLPMTGAAREEELLSAMARLKTTCTQPLQQLLDGLTRYSDLDVLVLSCYSSDAIQRSVERLRFCGNQVTFHLLGGDEE